MDFTIKTGAMDREVTEALILGIPEKVSLTDRGMEGQLRAMLEEVLEAKDFTGKLNQTVMLHTWGRLPARRLLLVGLGEPEKFSFDRACQAAGTASKMLVEMNRTTCTFAVETFCDGFDVSEATKAVVEGTLLGTYQYTQFKVVKSEEKRELEHVTLLTSSESNRAAVQEGLRLGQIIAEATMFARDLANAPGNWATPTRLAEEADRMAATYGLRYQALSEPELRELKMEAFLAVAKGSDEPCRFIILEHNAGRPELDTIVFIGKGITFDSGGISIKSSEKMDEMKFDMSGGAAVMGTLRAAAQLQIPLHVVGIIPATENLPSGKAFKPGDILRTSNGKTIEVVNTDAEGRIILADALAYAARYQPKAVVDLATLTGACVVALGHVATAILGKDPALIERLKRAGERTGERLWELPLWEDYDEQIDSDIADVKNTGGRPAGAITAAAFLAKFAEGYPWAHLDIAGTAWTDKEKPYIPKGGSGVGVRLLVEFLRDWQAGASTMP